MTAPTLESQSFWSCGGVATTQIKVTTPTGTQSGDLLLALMCRVAQNGAGTADTGWTRVSAAHATGGSGYYDAAWYYKVADGTESGDINLCTITSDKCGAFCFRISGYSGTPEEGAWGTPSVGTAPDAPSVTPSWGSADILAIVASASAYSNMAFTAPTNYSGAADDDNNIGPMSLGTAVRSLTGVSSEDPGAASWPTSAKCNANVVVVKGAAAAAGYSFGFVI